jgi:hypothetical protein
MADAGLGGMCFPMMVGSCIVSFSLTAVFILKEKFTFFQLGAMAVCISGLVLICTPASGKTKDIKDNKIVKAILRKSTKDFRANYSISKSAEVYELNENEISLINKVINLFSIDYAGIDFLINENNELIFNEIEDSVGARALYELTDINIASLYIEHIYKTLLCL